LLKLAPEVVQANPDVIKAYLGEEFGESAPNSLSISSDSGH